MLQAKTTELYGNWTVYSPSEEFMFRCGEKKIQWYLKKGLATPHGEKAIKLLFPPKGNGNCEDTTGYFKEAREARCVVCGTTEDLTKHHIVPHCYRRHFPEQYMSHESFDVVAVCIPCHEKYEQGVGRKHHEKQLNVCTPEELQEEKDRIKEVVKKEKIGSLIQALKRFVVQIPQARRQEILKELSDYYQTEVTLGILHTLIPPEIEQTAGYISKKIVEKQEDLEDFIVSWRKDFLLNMKPKFLSQNWIAHHETYF